MVDRDGGLIPAAIINSSHVRSGMCAYPIASERARAGVIRSINPAASSNGTCVAPYRPHSR